MPVPVLPSLAQPISQAIKAGQIGGGLTHGDHIIGGQSILGMGEAHLLPARSQALQDGYRIPDRLLYFFIHPFPEVLLGYAYLHAIDPPVQVGQIAALLR